MTQLWNVWQDSLELSEMPFYWRLSSAPEGVAGIPSRMPIRVTYCEQYDYLTYIPSDAQWKAIDTAYRQNANIGFVNPESGHLHTYGASVNRFFLEAIQQRSPSRIYEIGCGAGFSIQFLKDYGWSVTGIDPSGYSLEWSRKLGFPLLNDFFNGDLLEGEADFIYCNDVFEHVPDVEKLSRDVFNSLKLGGVFCFSTTNSNRSIELGDISMLEHQHVNMFTTRSIYLLLLDAGFSEISIKGGSYGNTFQVIATKGGVVKRPELPRIAGDGFFERAGKCLVSFEKFYSQTAGCGQYYVPLRCIPYLAAVGDFGVSPIYDSNVLWRGKFIDGYARPIEAPSDLGVRTKDLFFVGSLTFFDEIKRALLRMGYSKNQVLSIQTLTQPD
jgi:SAM-dependent methyltransferase